MAATSNNNITIDTTQVRAWAAKVDATSAETVQRYFNLAMKTGATIVYQREAQEAPRGVTGKLVKSLHQMVTEIAATIGPEHNVAAMSVVTGSKPHMPPVDAITDWANSKGINPWALAMSIKKKGTQANPFVERTFKATKDDVIGEFVIATKLIARSLASMEKL